jgi:hypothetical protein
MRYPSKEKQNKDHFKDDDLKDKDTSDVEDDIADLMGGLDDF